MKQNKTRTLSYTIHKLTQNKDVNSRPETIIFIEENTGGNLINVNSYQCFSRLDSKGKGNKSKNKYQIEKLLHSKGNHKQNKRGTYVNPWLIHFNV